MLSNLSLLNKKSSEQLFCFRASLSLSLSLFLNLEDFGVAYFLNLITKYILSPYNLLFHAFAYYLSPGKHVVQQFAVMNF